MTRRMARRAASFLLLLGFAPATPAASVWFDTPVVLSGTGTVDVGLYLDDFQLSDLALGLGMSVDFDFGSIAPPASVDIVTGQVPVADNPHVNLAQVTFATVNNDQLSILFQNYSSDPGPFLDTKLGTLSFDFSVPEASYLTFDVPDTSNLIFTATANVAPVPLPPAIWMFGGAMAAMVFLRRRRD